MQKHTIRSKCKMLFSFLITYFETYRKRCSVITQFHVMFISIRRCTSITWFQKSICVDSQSWLILGRNILSMVNVFQCSFEHCFMWIRRKRNEKKQKIQIRRVFIFYCFCISRFTCQITLFFVKPGFAHNDVSIIFKLNNSNVIVLYIRLLIHWISKDIPMVETQLEIVYIVLFSISKCVFKYVLFCVLFYKKFTLSC